MAAKPPKKKRKKAPCFWAESEEGDHTGHTSERCCHYICFHCKELGRRKACGCKEARIRDANAKRRAEADGAEGRGPDKPAGVVTLVRQGPGPAAKRQAGAVVQVSLPQMLNNQDFMQAEPAVVKAATAAQTGPGDRSVRDRAEEVMALRAIAAGDRDALGEMETILKARVQRNRDEGLEKEDSVATDRLLCVVEYGLQREPGAPTEDWVNLQLAMSQPGWANAGAPSAPAQAVARKLKKVKPSKKGGKGEGNPKKGKKGDPPPPTSAWGSPGVGH